VRSWPLDPFDEYVADGLGRDRIDEIADDNVPVVDRLAAPAHEHRVGVVLLDRVEDRFVDVVSDPDGTADRYRFPDGFACFVSVLHGGRCCLGIGCCRPGVRPAVRSHRRLRDPAVTDELHRSIDDLALLIDVPLAV
jgi:hypothetical protein